MVAKQREIVMNERDTNYGEQIRALRVSGLLNPDRTLKEIVATAQQIPGLGGSAVGEWVLISRDFVYKGGNIADAVVSEQAIAVLERSQILNFSITLGQILEMSQRIPGFGGSAVASWELISRDFVYKGSVAGTAGNVELGA